MKSKLSIIFSLISVIFYIISVFTFIYKNITLGIIFCGLGSTWLCLGTVFNKRK